MSGRSILDDNEMAANAFLDHARELLAAHPVTGNEVIQQAMSLLLDAPSYPELIVVERSENADEFTSDHFECPHCESACYPVMVDNGSWDTTVGDNGELDFGARTYDPWYDHETTMETLYVKTSCCGKPTRFPDGWTMK